MGAGGASWATAGALTVGGTNQFTRAGTVAGAARPFWPAYWTYTPGADGILRVDASATTKVGTGFPNPDTELYVYDGGSSELTGTQVGFDEDSGTGFTSKLAVSVQAGHTYTIKIGSFDSSGDQIGVYDLAATFAAVIVWPTDWSVAALSAPSSAHAAAMFAFPFFIYNNLRGCYVTTGFFPMQVDTVSVLADGTTVTHTGPAYTGSATGAVIDSICIGEEVLVVTDDAWLVRWSIDTSGVVTFMDEISLCDGVSGRHNDLFGIGYNALDGTIYVYYDVTAHAGGGTNVKSISMGLTFGARTDVGNVNFEFDGPSGRASFAYLIPGAGGRYLGDLGGGRGTQLLVRAQADPTLVSAVSTPISGSVETAPYPLGNDGLGVLGLPMLLASNRGLPVEQVHYNDSLPGLVVDSRVTVEDLQLDVVPGVTAFELTQSPGYDDVVAHIVIQLEDNSGNYLGYAIVFDPMQINGPRELHLVLPPTGESLRARVALNGNTAPDRVQLLLARNTAVDGSGTESYESVVWTPGGGGPPPPPPEGLPVLTPDPGSMLHELWIRLPDHYRAADARLGFPMYRYLAGICAPLSTLNDLQQRIDFVGEIPDFVEEGAP